MVSLNTTLERLYRSHAGELRAFTRRRVGAQDAEDIVQDAYLRALQEGDVASIHCHRAYLFRIAANLTIDAARKAQVRARYADGEGNAPATTEPEQQSEAAIEAFVELRQLCAHLDELPPPCRKAFLLFWLDDLDHSETALQLGVTVRTVNRYLSRALEHLQRRVARGVRADATDGLPGS
ncbi:MAG: RNA polymerase subunit sigma-24 [Methylocystaceae bacterium]|nr:MAG: RNA polymerase subunit sigma-24 [Methylocystaceae bacterium]